MNTGPTEESQSPLQRALGLDPAELKWPQEFSVSIGSRNLAAVFDPHNAVVTIYGASAADFSDSEVAAYVTSREQTPAYYSRLVVFAAPSAPDGWSAFGFKPEGSIAGYWADGTAAELWSRSWGGRAGVATPKTDAPDVNPVSTEDLPSDWVCRPADPDDAVEITDLLRQVFPDYPVAVDPGSLRYGLASVLLHGRVIRDRDDRLVAYAAVEFQPGGGAVEITDCATAPAFRNQGLMTRLIRRLQEDLADVFDGRACYSLAREDQPAMQRVLAQLAWRRRGCLVNQFRVGTRWVSGWLWSTADSP